LTVNNERSDNSVEFYRDRVARIVPTTGKIYDITHADTNEHTVALPATYPANTKAIIITGIRIAGTGYVRIKSVSGGTGYDSCLDVRFQYMWIRATDGLFYYNLSVANDDFDVYATGYVTG